MATELPTSKNVNDGTPDYVGGIVGITNEKEIDMVINCINIGNIEVSVEERIMVGGILGRTRDYEEDYTINNVFNKGTVTVTKDISNSYSSSIKIGGIIGEGYSNMAHCYNMGSVQHIPGSSGKITKNLASIMGMAHDRKYFDCEYLEGTAEYGSKGSDVDSTSDDDKDTKGNAITKVDADTMTEDYVIQKMNNNVKEYNNANENTMNEWAIKNGKISIVK